MRAEEVTVTSLAQMKRRGERITMVTAYDAPAAGLAARAGMDTILVGDSLGMVVLGHDSTLPVTMEAMVHHTAAARRGLDALPPDVRRPLLIADLPFMTARISTEETLRHGARLLQDGGAQAVKIEGAGRALAALAALSEAGIPVMGHLGLTPQSVHAFGGYRVQARSEATARQLLHDARSLAGAGCFALVLETVPWRAARLVTERLAIPTIGIGAGEHCSGQVLVWHDLLGLEAVARHRPKYLKRYAQLDEDVVAALRRFGQEVKEGQFPAAEHRYLGEDEELAQLEEELAPPAASQPAGSQQHEDD